MEKQEFVYFRNVGNDQSVKSEHFFRKDKVKYFGVTERTAESGSHYFDVRISYETSDTSSDTFQVLMPDTTEFEMFRDQMLDTPAASAEELEKIRNGLLHADTPEEPKEKPPFVTRDSLEITEGAEDFFNWLYGKYFNSVKSGCWSFRSVPGTQDEEFIVCHKPNTLSSPADVHIAFRNHCKYARVCGIVVNDHYTPDFVGFNIILREFVNNIVIPYAFTHKITYSYSGTTNEQPTESRGTDAPPVNTETLDTLKFTDGVAGFYCFLLTKEHFKDTSNWSVSRCLDDKFKCDFDDLNGGEESFSVYVQFKSDASYGAVITVGATENLSPEQYNRHLKRFVDEMVKPYAEIQQLTYEYSGKC